MIGCVNGEHRVLPHSDEAERAILGSVLRDSTVLANVRDVGVEDFCADANRKIFGAMLELEAEGVPIDHVSVGDQLSRKNLLIGDVGLADYLGKLVDDRLFPHHVRHYADMLLEKSRHRRRIELASQILRADTDGDRARGDELIGQLAKLSTVGKRQYEFERLTGQQFLAGNFTEEYLVDGVLVKGQPCIIAAPKKALKTCLSVDLLMALAAGDYFCGGKFKVQRPVRVGVMSGESGKATLQETAKRITRAMRPDGWSAEELERQRWCFQVPRLGEKEHLDALRRFIEQDRLEVLIIDPTYLALPVGENAGNLFHVGSLLLALTELGQETGCTIVLIHHLRKNVADAFSPPELEDIAWSGFAEWARQWILIGRREKYDPDSDGEHQLWLNIGGSAGHSSLWAVDIREGKRTDEGGRRWSVTVNTASVARQKLMEARKQGKEAKKTEAEAQKQETIRKNAERVEEKLANRFQDGVTKTDLKAACGMNGATIEAALARLADDGRAVKNNNKWRPTPRRQEAELVEGGLPFESAS